MAQPSKVHHQVQEVLIKNLIMRCKAEKDQEEVWPMPEMVGYYNESPLPIATVQPADVEPRLSVKKVVCSPDLPIAEFPANSPQKPLPSPGPHTEVSSVQCQLCRKMYTSKAAFQAHQRTHHATPTSNKETEDPYRCNICSKTFAVPARLTRHYRTHTGEKPFRCEFCNKSFSVKENLSVHRRIHTKERPYKCEVCSRAFEHSGKLHRHMRIHTGERPHKCTVCAKTFIQSGQLVIHMRTHTGEKPYVCAVCQKGFTCSKQLKVHSRTHTGEKPYSCEICGKSFGYNHVLKLHQVAHYGEKVYKCTICNHTFNSKKSMEAHIKSHSENNNNNNNLVPPTAPTPPASSESSCSSSSDKENKDSASSTSSSPPPLILEPSAVSYESDIRYYIYPSGRDRLSSPAFVPHQSYSAGVELLAAAAERDEKFRASPDVIFNIIAKGGHHQEALRQPAYFTTPSVMQYAPLDAGDDIRKRVEAALAADEVPSSSEEETNLPTPPSSNPVSPAPSVSPVDPELSLPPRKRSKMILKSMEATIDLSPVRYSSVIHYARAS